MRKPIWINWTQPQPVDVRLNGTTEAYLFGSVAKGTANQDSDLDVYVAGVGAEQIEARFFLRRPLVRWEGTVRELHVIGPMTTDKATFLASQPEARRIL